MIDKIRKILEGIDKTEADNINGWWETSVGAEFGAEKLKEIEQLFINVVNCQRELLSVKFKKGTKVTFNGKKAVVIYKDLPHRADIELTGTNTILENVLCCDLEIDNT